MRRRRQAATIAAMRPLALLLLAVLACASDEEDARHALAALRRGDLAPLAALPAGSGGEPADLPDPAQPGLRRRWSHWLPGLVAGLPAAARGEALELLAVRCRDDAGAIDALPAEVAMRRLGAAAARAFDHGRFAEARLLWRLLARSGMPPPPQAALADRLAGDGAEVDAGLALASPAAVAPLQERRPAPATAELRAAGPWLVADDPWGRRLWRRELAGGEQVTAGGGWALLHGPAGLAAIDPDGGRHALPPPPARTRVAAVGGGGAWFLRPPAPGARGRGAGDPPQAWRYALADGAVAELAMEEEPLGPPLVRGTRSLWLGRLRLWLGEPGRPAAGCWHGLDLGADAHLAWSGRTPAIVDGERAWTVLASGEAAGDAPPAARLAQVRAAPPADGLRVAARRDGLWLVVEAHDGAGLRWRRRWAARSEDAAPSQTALVAGDAVSVLEGSGDLTTLAAGDGALRGWGLITAGACDPELALAWGPGRAAAAQLGRRDRLLLSVDGDERTLALAAPLRALRAADGGLEADLGTGWRPLP